MPKAEFLTNAEANKLREAMKPLHKKARQSCIESFSTYCHMINPSYYYGECHVELQNWMQDVWEGNGYKTLKDALILWPRGHLKSHHLAMFVTWVIVRDPSLSHQYVTKGETLGKMQLHFIQGVLTSKEFNLLFPEYVDMTRIRKWSEQGFRISHPEASRVRDWTLLRTTLGVTTTGAHPDAQWLDDIVDVQFGSNKALSADTPQGRQGVREAVTALSDQMAHGRRFVVGTRYHPDDQYNTFLEMTVPILEEDVSGKLIEVGRECPFAVNKTEVEKEGEFLWPAKTVTINKRDKTFGFDQLTLERKRAEHKARNLPLDQFYAQFYNEANPVETKRLTSALFRKWSEGQVQERRGKYYASGQLLNIYMGLDLAETDNSWSDWTALTVIGVDYKGEIWVLDIDRWKTRHLHETRDKIKDMYNRYPYAFQCSVSCARKEQLTVDTLQTMLQDVGCNLILRKSPAEEKKEVRIISRLEPYYSEKKVWHPPHELTAALEHELDNVRPKHDDLKDSLSCAVEEIIRPPRSTGSGGKKKPITYNEYGLF